jgi:inorganic triphosphatase YgiF
VAGGSRQGNDARREYAVALEGDSLTFVDPAGCRIDYVRA